MTGDERVERAALADLPFDEAQRRATRKRLQTALSCSAVAGLVLVGDLVHQLDARADTEAAAKKIGTRRKPPRHSSWPMLLAWVIVCLSVVALIVVILVTT